MEGGISQGSWRDGTGGGPASHFKTVCSGLVAIMNFFYLWQRRCKTQPSVKLEDNLVVFGWCFVCFFFFPTASFNSFQTWAHPSNPLSKSNNARSPHPCTRKVLKYTYTPKSRSSLYLLRSRPEGSIVSSYIDIFMEAGKLSFIKIRAVILSVTCSHNILVQYDMYHQGGYQ